MQNIFPLHKTDKGFAPPPLLADIPAKKVSFLDGSPLNTSNVTISLNYDGSKPWKKDSVENIIWSMQTARGSKWEKYNLPLKIEHTLV